MQEKPSVVSALSVRQSGAVCCKPGGLIDAGLKWLDQKLWLIRLLELPWSLNPLWRPKDGTDVLHRPALSLMTSSQFDEIKCKTYCDVILDLPASQHNEGTPSVKNISNLLVSSYTPWIIWSLLNTLYFTHNKIPLGYTFLSTQHVALDR